MSDFRDLICYVVSLSEQAQQGRSCRLTLWQHREEALQQNGRVSKETNYSPSVYKVSRFPAGISVQIPITL